MLTLSCFPLRSGAGQVPENLFKELRRSLSGGWIELVLAALILVKQHRKRDGLSHRMIRRLKAA